MSDDRCEWNGMLNTPEDFIKYHRMTFISLINESLEEEGFANWKNHFTIYLKGVWFNEKNYPSQR